MNLVDEIYAVLVERFGVGEIFLKKFGTSRPKSISWKEFTDIALTLDIPEVNKFCGCQTSASFSKVTRRNYATICEEKGHRSWRTFFLDLINRKYCPSCNTYLMQNEFNKHQANSGGLASECRACNSARGKNYYTDNIEKIRKKHSEYYYSNKDKVLQYRIINKDLIAEKARDYYLINRDSILDKKKIYYTNNKSDFIARNAKRRAAKLQATPKWADLEAIKEIYKKCPEGSHVDHWAPLQGELVCGLHCEFNLQYLTAEENQSKWNKFEVC